MKESNNKQSMSILRERLPDGNNKVWNHKLSIRWNEEVEEMVIYAGEDKQKKGGGGNLSV